MKRLPAMFAVILCALASATGLVRADQRPTTLLKERDGVIRAYLKDHPLPLTADQRSHVENELNELFDYRMIAVESLGRHQKTATAKQLAEYIDVFAQVTRRTSSSEESLKAFLEGKIEYKNERNDPDGNTVVKTVIVKNEEEIVVEYVFQNQKGRWRIVDYVLDDVGLVENYRSSFGKIITDNGFDDLTRRLREKLAD